MRYLDVCTGLSAASVAWRPLGWKASGFAEIDKFPRRVLAHHYPGVHNHGDFTTIDVSHLGSVDLLVGGTPCQAFSVAGKRQSLADARGNLTLAYTVLAHELARSNGLRWAVWENVPGVLSTDDNAFGCFLGSLVGSDDAIVLPRGVERWPDAGMVSGPRARAAWRILDAQYFGLAQRRRRVFVVAGFTNGADPAAVLFERKGLRGDYPPRRETGQGIAASSAYGIDRDCIDRSGEGANGTARERSGLGIEAELAYALKAKGPGAVAYGGNRTSGPLDVATAINAHGGPNGRCDFESETFVAQIAPAVSASNPYGDHESREGLLVAHAFDARQSDVIQYGDKTGPIDTDPHTHGILCFTAKDHGADAQADLSPTLRAGGFTKSHANAGVMPAVAFVQNSRSEVRLFGEDGQTTGAISAEPGAQQQTYVAQQWAVRRLTPIECARLQGFPDDYLALPGAADGPQYKALGNSFAVPVVRWIGERIAAHDASLKQAEAA